MRLKERLRLRLRLRVMDSSGVLKSKTKVSGVVKLNRNFAARRGETEDSLELEKGRPS